MVSQIRRVVTGHDAQGRSTIIFDGPAAQVKEMASMPGLALTDLWETSGAPADNDGMADAADRPVRLEPANGGAIFRTVEFPPDSHWQGQADAALAFNSIGAGAAHDSASSDPMRHKTNTVDLIFVLKGEIEAIVDTGRVLLRQGDAFIQRGTMHSWSVPGDEPCILGVVLIDARPAG